MIRERCIRTGYFGVSAISFMILALLITQAATAATIVFSQDPVNHAVSRISDWSDDKQKADDFVLAGDDVIITKIYWWGSYGTDPDPAVDDFVFKFFEEDPFQSGQPYPLGYTDSTRFPKDYTAVNFNREPTDMISEPSGVHDGGVVYAYWAVLDQPIIFTPGKRYWLAITNKTPTWAWPSVPNSKWGWFSSQPGDHWHRLGHCPMCAQEWLVSETTNLAFRLESDVVSLSRIAEVKALQSNSAFTLTAKSMSYASDGLMFVQEPDGSCGMKVNFQDTIPDQSPSVVITGVYQGLVDNEPTVDAILIGPGSEKGASSVGLPNKSVGWSGSGIPAYAGIDTRCLLVRTWGEITYMGPDFFLLEDGSGVSDDESTTGKKGLRVFLPAETSLPPDVQFVTVTGISRATPDGRRWLMPRDAGDIHW